ncbi:MAG TPA: hypothetical protein VFP22_09305, partial [Candidatus Limnocylindrales bacterium]|nr:hypothetical protein [Candidatus Limnocylindrales bacterium]
IEAVLARRAPRGPDPDLLMSIMAGTREVRQVRSWWPAPTRTTTRLLFVAAAVAVGLLAMWLVAAGGGFTRRPEPSLPATLSGRASEEPSTAPSNVVLPSSDPSAPSASMPPCATETTAVTFGAAMLPTSRAPMSVPAGILDRGAYVTKPDDGSPGPADVWFVTAGNARRVASVVGPDFNRAIVDDISVDGRFILLDVGALHGGLPLANCDDLYVIRTDGTGVTRLTTNGSELYDTAGRFSPDGRWVASAHAGITATSPAFDLFDLMSGGPPRLELCGGPAQAGSTSIAWAPDSRNVAVQCGSTLEIRSVVASGQAAVTGVGPNPIGVAWTSATSIVIVSAVPGDTANRPLTFRTLPVTGAGVSLSIGSLSDVRTISPDLADANGRMEIAPDGHEALVLASPTPPDGDRWYVVDFRTATAKPVTGVTADFDDGVGWSKDSRSIVWFDRWARDVPQLVQIDVATGERHTYATVKAPNVDGLFRGG